MPAQEGQQLNQGHMSDASSSSESERMEVDEGAGALNGAAGSG